VNILNARTSVEFTLQFLPGDHTGNYVKHMAYKDGVLFINARPVASMKKGPCLYWNDNVSKNGNIENGCSLGCLKRIHGSRLFSGVLLTRTGPVRFKASVDSAYAMTFRSVHGEAEQRYRLVMGSRTHGQSRTQTLELCKAGESVNLALSKVYEKKENNVFKTHVRGRLLPSINEFENFGFFDVTIDDSYTSLSGFAWREEETHTTEKPLFTISGEYEENDNEWMQRIQALPPAMAPHSPQCTATQIAALDAGLELDVESLFYLPMPVVEDVNQQYPQMLPTLMKYVISDKQLAYIGNPARPRRGQELTEEQAALTEDPDIKSFLTGNFYYAYLSSMLADNDCGEYSSLIRNIPSYAAKLNGYYSGSLSTSMCNDPGYSKLNEQLYPSIYFQSTPEIKPYLDNRTGWAEKLHDYVRIEENTYAMLDEYAHQAQSSLQHMVILLNYLDNQKRVPFKRPQKCGFTSKTTAKKYSISYGANLYYTLMNRMIAFNAYDTNFSGMQRSKGERKSFYDAAAQELFASVLAKKQLSEDEADLKQAAEEALQKGSISKIEDYYHWISFTLTEFENFMSGATEKAILPGLAEFFSEKTGLGRGLRWTSAVLCQGLMIWNQVSDYCDWEKLTPAQQAETVMSSIYSLVDFAGIIGPELTSAKVAEALSEVSSSSASAAAGEAEAEQVLRGANGFFEDVKAGAKAMSTGSKILGGIMSALAFAMSVCDIVSDQAVYGSDNWLFALDVLVSVANGLAVLASVSFCFISLELVGTCTFAAMLPGIGWICTALGILLALIAALVKKSSKTLEQIYIETHCVPFVTRLEIPAQAIAPRVMFLQAEATRFTLCRCPA